MFDPKFLVLNGHGRPGVHLYGQHTIERAAFLVEINQVRSRVPIDPVLVMVAAHEHAILMPFAGGKFLHGHLAGNPGTALLIDRHFLAGVRQNATAFFLIQHAVVIGVLGDDIALISRRRVQTEVRPHAATVLDTAVAAGGHAHLHA